MCVPNPSTLTVEGKDLIKLRCIFMSPHALTDGHAVNVRSQQLSVTRINGLLYNMVLGPRMLMWLCLAVSVLVPLVQSFGFAPISIIGPVFFSHLPGLTRLSPPSLLLLPS